MKLRHDAGVYSKQTVAITLQMIHSIRILQYSAAELEKFLSEQAESNPLVDVKMRSDAGVGAGSGVRGEPRVSDTGGAGGHERSGTSGGGYGDAGSQPTLDSYLAATITLREYLSQQAAMGFRDPTDRLIAAELIEALDDSGYLTGTVGNLAARLGTAEGRIERVLTTFQGFDPIGVGARSLSECLAIQLREKDRLDPAMECLLENLPMLAKYELKKLSKICGVDLEDITDMAAEIRALDPRPGRQFDSTPTPPALPDVVVRAAEQGGHSVELNTSLLPRVLVNRQYYAEITSGPLGETDKRFVMDCMRNANWIARKVDQRAQTILKVATEIVDQQGEFFEKGIEHLKPLNLSDVAKAVGVHQSTVCRAISNKFLTCNRGIFEMRYFFMNSIPSADGASNHSSETVRHKIAQLVGSETASTVHSDEAIVAELRRDGIEIARRTVAKYRDIMNIPSSLQRRRRKQAEGLLGQREAIEPLVASS